MNNKVFILDDDVELLKSYERNLHNQFELTTCNNPLKAVDILKENKNFGCIISDLKMNQLNGIEFLSLAKDIQPFTPRILLTGFADLKNSIEAINRANIFRLLTKPIGLDTFTKVINEALDYCRLSEIERELMDKTLKSTIKILLDILSLAQPKLFTHSKELMKLVSLAAKKIGVKKSWEVEIAYMLSNIGAVAIPYQLIQKKMRGESLNYEAERMISSIPEMSYKLISQVPHLNKIAKIIKNQNIDNFALKDESDNEAETLKIAHLIKISKEYETKLARNYKISDIFEYFKENYDIYNQEIVKALEESVFELKNNVIINKRQKINKYLFEKNEIKSSKMVIDIPLNKIETGMVLAEPIRDGRGRIILNKDYELDELLCSKIKNLSNIITIKEPIKIYVKSN